MCIKLLCSTVCLLPLIALANPILNNSASQKNLMLAQNSPQPVVTGEIQCLEDGKRPSFEIVHRTSQEGRTCEEARRKVERYFEESDKCRNPGPATYPNRSWDRSTPIKWLQTNSCR